MQEYSFRLSAELHGELKKASYKFRHDMSEICRKAIRKAYRLNIEPDGLSDFRDFATTGGHGLKVTLEDWMIDEGYAAKLRWVLNWFLSDLDLSQPEPTEYKKPDFTTPLAMSSRIQAEHAIMKRELEQVLDRLRRHGPHAIDCAIATIKTTLKEINND